MKGKIHSIETMGAVDGPGLRYVLFMQGCCMRCKYCHNPDSWDFSKGTLKSVGEIIKQVKQYKHYFQNNGGITVTGGEPLLQIDFLIKLFKKLKKININTCLDTSGIIFDRKNKKLLKKFNKLIHFTDLIMLDIKHIDEEKHKNLTGHSNKNVLNFARFINEHNVNLWIRYVLVPTINSDDKTLKDTKKFINKLDCVKKIEILPYHTMGIEKYKKLGIKYPLEGINPPNQMEIENAKKILKIERE